MKFDEKSLPNVETSIMRYTGIKIVIRSFRRSYVASYKVFVYILLCGCIVCTNTGAMEQGKPVISDTDLQLAQNLLATGQLEESLRVLYSYRYTKEQSQQFLFLVGLASVELSLRTTDEEVKQDLLVQAVAAFREILVDNPEFVRVRLELARAFFLQNKDTLAKEHFERVLAGDPPEAVQANINGFIEAMHSRRRFRGSLSFQMVGESNINSGTTDKTIWFNSLPFQRSGADPKTAVGIVIRGQGNYRYPVSDTVDHITGIGYSRSEFPGSDFDRNVLDFHTGPEYRLSGQTRVGLQGFVIANINEISPNNKIGGRVSLKHSTSIRTNLDFQLSFGKRSYQSSENTNNNADEFEVTLNLNHRLSPTLTLDGGFTVGRSHIQNNSKQQSRTFQWSAGVSSLLKTGLTVGFSFSNSRKSYEGQPGFPTRDGLPQMDKFRILRATVLRRDLNIWGFSPQLALIHEKLSTNAQASDFKNTMMQVIMVKQF